MATFVDAGQASGAEAAAPGLRGSMTATHVDSNKESNGNASPILEDGYPKDLEIPIRYVKGMEGDMEEARRRWIATLKVCEF